MNVTKDVIRDLLPVYLAGEASADTRALIEEYARQDEEIRAALLNTGVELPPVTAASHEKETLKMTKTLLRWRSTLLALAIFCTAAPFTFIHMRDVRFFMLRDAPGSAAVYGGLALCFWIGYLWVGRRLKVTGV